MSENDNKSKQLMEVVFLSDMCSWKSLKLQITINSESILKLSSNHYFIHFTNPSHAINPFSRLTIKMLLKHALQ